MCMNPVHVPSQGEDVRSMPNSLPDLLLSRIVIITRLVHPLELQILRKGRSILLGNLKIVS